MGRVSRDKPKRLAEKLLQIRVNLGLSQNQMLEKLGLNDKVFRSAISGYELGTREPTLPIVLKYARLAGISTDVLIDDALELPQSR
ncbi:MAG: helix-turn-helix domain-containing protein [Acidobacteriota bacterium]|nr:helix-turn-helix domain-containing protein [Acidobacteriota bacterium]